MDSWSPLLAGLQVLTILGLLGFGWKFWLSLGELKGKVLANLKSQERRISALEGYFQEHLEFHMTKQSSNTSQKVP